MIGCLCLLLLLQTPNAAEDSRDCYVRATELLHAGQTAQALALYDRGLELAQRAGDSSMEFHHQHGRANVHLLRKQLRRGHEAIAEMERLQGELTEPGATHHLHRIRAAYHITLRDHPRAQEQLEILADLLAERGEELWPEDRVNLARCLLRQGLWEEAREELMLAQDSMDETTRPSLRVDALLLLGDVAATEQDWERALQSYEASESAARDVRDGHLWSQSLARQCELRLRQGRLEELQERLPGLMAEAAGLGPGILLNLCLELSPVVQMLGPSQARAHVERIRALVEDPEGGGARVVEAWQKLGLHHLALGELAEARVWLERALAGLPEGAAEHTRGRILVHLAVLRVVLGDLTQAGALLQEAQALAESCDDPAALGLVLHNLGSVRVRERRWPEALALFEQAEEAFPATTVGMDPFVRRAWWDARIAQGEVLHRSGRHEEATAHLSLVLSQLQSTSDRLLEARCQARLAELESSVGDHAGARRHATAAIGHFRELGSAEEELELLDELARAALADGDGAEVTRLLDDALRLLRRPSVQPLDPYARARRRGLFAEWAGLSQELTLWELGRARPEERSRLVERGLSRAADWKAQTLAERMGVVSDGTRTQTRRRQALVSWSESVGRTDLPGGGPWSPEVEEILGEDLTRVERRLDDLAAAEQTLQPWIRDWRVAELKDFTTTRDALVMEFVETRERLLVYVVAKGACDLVDLGPREDLIELLGDFRDAVAGRRYLSRFLQAGDRVHRRVLEPVWERVGSPVPQRWWVVPTPELAGVPWAAVPLQDGREEKKPRSFFDLRFLVDQVEIGVAPSSAVLVAWDRIPAPAAPQRALLLGDPEVPADLAVGGAVGPLKSAREELVHVAQTLARHRETDQDEQHRLVAEPLVERDRNLFLEDHYALVLGAEASADWLQDTREFGLLHLVAHGTFAGGPSSTGLWLAPDQRGQVFLSTEDVFQLDLRARLVVLSACESGSGAVLPGEGVQSLAWAFLCAGARGAVATQWPVDDEHTAGLMAAFYESLIGQGLHPVQALALSQRHVARLARSTRGPGVRIGGPEDESHTRDEKAHPWFWAAFQYQGDPGR